jgi:hypothetical protein
MMVVVAVEKERQVQVSQFGSQVAYAAQEQQGGEGEGSGLFHNNCAQRLGGNSDAKIRKSR